MIGVHDKVTQQSFQSSQLFCLTFLSFRCSFCHGHFFISILDPCDFPECGKSNFLLRVLCARAFIKTSSFPYEHEATVHYIQNNLPVFTRWNCLTEKQCLIAHYFFSKRSLIFSLCLLSLASLPLQNWCTFFKQKSATGNGEGPWVRRAVKLSLQASVYR